VRELGELGIAVEFEKEDIDTGNMGSEMLLSILGSAAQEESLYLEKPQMELSTSDEIRRFYYL